MPENGKQPVLVVVQLTGGNDFMNTIIPYTNPIYYDNRTKVVIPQEQVLPIDETLAFNPNAAPLKDMYDRGKVAVVQGIGYPNSSRSHFRALDIWHTCEPDTVGTEGWLGRAIRELDPHKENVLTGLNIGRGLPRAMAAPSVLRRPASSPSIQSGTRRRRSSPLPLTDRNSHPQLCGPDAPLAEAKPVIERIMAWSLSIAIVARLKRESRKWGK